MNDLLVAAIRIAPETVALLVVTATGLLQRRRIAEVLDRLTGVKVGAIEFQFGVQRLADARPEHPIPKRDLAKLGEHLSDRRAVLQGARILWVDDIPSGNRVERAVLRQLGTTVVNAVSSREALDWLMRDDFDLVITDLERDGDVSAGLTFGREVHQLTGGTIPVVGYLGSVDHERGIPQGFEALTDRPDGLFLAVLDALGARAPTD